MSGVQTATRAGAAPAPGQRSRDQPRAEGKRTAAHFDQDRVS